MKQLSARRAQDRAPPSTLAASGSGTAEPLHDWYPYLEGYSPTFVVDALRAFAPSARSVLDPFAGTGTTPLTAAMLGCQAYYCELNPLLQFLVEAKAAVLSMSQQQRRTLAARLGDLAEHLPATLAQHPPDARLAATHTQTFGDSRFFPPATYEDCLRARSWLDRLAEHPIVADVVTVATVAALLPCSYMIRRGDLRFRTPDECRHATPPLADCIRQRLLSMMHDLPLLPSVENRPTLIMEDAKRVAAVPGIDVEAIVTSPPYLNGTNYYRNTKIELWFLRALSSGDDLARFRLRTVTAGINDVRVRQEAAPVSELVENLVRKLNRCAYDRRIPIMVSRYFADMRQVFDGISKHAKPGAPLILDIGDSCYANTHVDTPTVLADLLRSAGWQFEREVLLRSRHSPSRQRLRQVLLVAFAPRHRRRGRPAKPLPKWEAFKLNLPHQSGTFAKRNWGSPLHSLCSYQGKLKPAIAHHLVTAVTKPGDRLLDPFGGVGTIAFEAALHGVSACSFDISPVAVTVAAAKLAPATPSECLSIVSELGNFLRGRRPTEAERRDASRIRFNGSLADYFHPRTLDEVLLARRFFQELSASRSGGAFVLGRVDKCC